MKKEKNAQCAHLVVEDDAWKKRHDGLMDLMMMQRDIQTDVYRVDFDEMQKRLGNIVEFFKMNNLAIDDERMEQYEALGGVHSFGKAVWKPWKSDHQKAINRPLSDLTDDELIELKYELVDELHFFFNKCWSIGLGPVELYKLYVAKNKENIDRQLRGY